MARVCAPVGHAAVAGEDDGEGLADVRRHVRPIVDHDVKRPVEGAELRGVLRNREDFSVVCGWCVLLKMIRNDPRMTRAQAGADVD